MDKKVLVNSIKDNVKQFYTKKIEEASLQEIYQATAYAVRDLIMDDWIDSTSAIKNKKIVYYMSMEFLIGRMLGNNIISLMSHKLVSEALEELGVDLTKLEEEERDPALGNGGLGRLSACFLDSLSTMGYPAIGCGIRYKYGMFRQLIKNGEQVEVPDCWLEHGYPFEVKRSDLSFEIKFGGNVRYERDEKGRELFIQENYNAIRAVAYDIPVIGYGNKMVNALRIWDAQPLQPFELASFDRGNYFKAVEQENLAKTIVEVLYPNDSHYEGKELRLKQQYFFVSASLQAAVNRHIKLDGDILNLPNKVVFHMNDTHPTVAVAELMRILMDEHKLSWDEAFDLTCKCCSYTNHTIMKEAIEQWPVDLFARLLPRIYQIVEEINRRFIAKITSTYPGDYDKIRNMAIVYEGQVRMANLAIACSFSVNGVAKIHTEILKAHTFADFYKLMPEKFNNKTNGVTHRRFVLHANPLLSKFISERIGDAWIRDFSQISKLKKFINDKKSLEEFFNIKRENKKRLAKYIKDNNNIDVEIDTIFDVQVKRLHEYKRQTLNILHIIYLYHNLKTNPNFTMHPTTFIFGAKASAGYAIAKEIIKLINGVAKVVNSDSDVNDKLKVVFIEDYRVSNAEIIFSATDISEQISTASFEASGTGNMKMMMNGAVTLGTMDGANIEIVDAVGRENAYIFGLSSEDVLAYKKMNNYFPQEIIENDEDIRKVLDLLIDGTFSSGDKDAFRNLYNHLVNFDTYMTLKDFKSYAEIHKIADNDYRNKDIFVRKMFINTCSSGKFNSDRTIDEYVREIWKLNKVVR